MELLVIWNNISPSVCGAARTRCVSRGRLRKAMMAKIGIEQSELPATNQGFVGPSVPLKSASRKPAKNKGAMLVIKNNKPTKPSIERTVFHGLEVWARIRFAGAGESGMTGTLCIKFTKEGLCFECLPKEGPAQFAHHSSLK